MYVVEQTVRRMDVIGELRRMKMDKSFCVITDKGKKVSVSDNFWKKRIEGNNYPTKYIAYLIEYFGREEEEKWK